ncbi:MAG: cell division protein ZipA [Legionellales bacterium]|nr:cell division protein ZipA [Legionellales bacterium]
MLTVGKLVVIGLIIGVIGLVVGALIRMRQERQQQDLYTEPDLGDMHDLLVDDEAVAVRQVTSSSMKADEVVTDGIDSESVIVQDNLPLNETPTESSVSNIIALNVFARNEQQFAGYELLQALLANGFRFGEMDIFHRYQHDHGQGPILFSLACATEPGTFDMQNMGSFACQGLLIFMELSGHAQIDEERFELLLSVVKQLAEELNAMVMDHKRTPLVENRITQYRNRVRLQSEVA